MVISVDIEHFKNVPLFVKIITQQFDVQFYGKLCLYLRKRENRGIYLQTADRQARQSEGQTDTYHGVVSKTSLRMQISHPCD